MNPDATDADYWIDGEEPRARQAVAGFLAASALARAGANVDHDVAYGGHERECFDMFWPADAPRALLIFIHGGWWKAGSKDSRAFIAPAWTKEGFAVATVNYPLAPGATLTEIAASVKAAVDAICTRVCELTQLAVPYVIAGNSAGGHLTAYLGSAGQEAANGTLVGLCAMSGLYDLAPLKTTFLKEWIDFSDATVTTLSPLRLTPRADVGYLLLVGAQEPPGFEAQQTAFSAYLATCGVACAAEVVADRGHLTIIQDLTDTASLAHRWILARVNAHLSARHAGSA